jgi:hypothetical protein
MRRYKVLFNRSITSCYCLLVKCYCLLYEGGFTKEKITLPVFWDAEVVEITDAVGIRTTEGPRVHGHVIRAIWTL